MYHSRRAFIKTSGMASIGFLGLSHFLSNALMAAEPVMAAGYGPLLTDPKGLLNLPKGFSYQIISRHGERMTDGFFTPARPDGMTTFKAGKDRIIIIRNHENGAKPFTNSPFGKSNELLSKIDKNKVYDYGQGKEPWLGGTTTMVYNEKTGKVETSYLSLAGTARNCAGGPTPWGSWISCEEDTTSAGGFSEKNHGYNFEVPASEKPFLADPVPLKAMGRFNHEAVCIDPRTGIVYQTEDRNDGLIYRFIPNKPSQLREGGRLQALMIKDRKSADTRNWDRLSSEKLPLRQLMDVVWIDLEDIDAPKDDLRIRGFEQGAARFARGEGMWFGDKEVLFACTNGGRKEKGQVFRYVPSPNEGSAKEIEQPGQLEIFAEPNDAEIVKYCDNLTVAPWGDVILCEDHPRPFVVGVNRKGEFYRLAENTGIESEFAGGVFSPSGKTFFVNIQDAGLTIAITGPWQKA